MRQKSRLIEVEEQKLCENKWKETRNLMKLGKLRIKVFWGLFIYFFFLSDFILLGK